MHCKCRKNSVQCGPGCTCDNCCNHPVSQQVSIAEDMPDSESESESESGEYDELNDDVDDMRSIFGELDYTDDNMETFTLCFTFNRLTAALISKTAYA